MENIPATRGLPLATEFIQMTVPLYPGGIALRDAIETQLQAHGDPLRWAITAVDSNGVQVEAVVTVATSQDALTPGPGSSSQNQ